MKKSGTGMASKWSNKGDIVVWRRKQKKIPRRVSGLYSFVIRSGREHAGSLQNAGSRLREMLEAWLQNFLVMEQSDFNMLFEDFVKIYYADMETRLREHTMRTKKYIIDLKVLPYFGKIKMNEIKAADICRWQNELLKQGYAPTYLKTINNQVSAIFNYAVKYYDLPNNPCRKAGSIGKSRADEMQFWTQEEFEKFAEAIMDKQQSYMAFTTLFWTGLRLGELLALTPGDFNFEKKTLRINKLYQRLEGKDVITDPKTPKSNRIIVMPDFLTIEMEDFIKSIYGIKMDDRIFTISKSYLHHEMDRGAKLAGVKRIRIHGLRHSHISLLINLGFSALAIGERVGHEAVDITYHYAHLFPTVQTDMAAQLATEREALVNVRKE